MSPLHDDDPPPYEDPQPEDADKLVPPTIHILYRQAIHPESPDADPIYELTRGVAHLTHATSEVELRRVDRAVRTDAAGQATVTQRRRHIYDLRLQKGIHGTLSTLPSDSPPFFVEPMSRRELGAFALDKSRLRSQWKACPMDLSGKSSKYNRPAFLKGGKHLFEVRRKDGRYEWADAEGRAIAVEDQGEEQHRLLVTASLRRDVVDALVALWCCRLWQYSAEHQEPLYTGADAGKFCPPPGFDQPHLTWVCC